MNILRNPLIASFLALAASVINSRITGRPSNAIGRLARYPLKKRAWVNPHQGEKECARRRRQIERGMLTEANGLVRRERYERTLHLGNGTLYLGDKELGTFTDASIQLGCA